jgi:hypothetical protein
MGRKRSRFNPSKCPICGCKQARAVAVATLTRLQKVEQILYACARPGCPQKYWYIPRALKNKIILAER